jgi:hypothetical protein
MKGDFSRVTDDPRKSFLRVLQQQGRVELDADANEQTSILLRYLQTLAADLIGPFGGPESPRTRVGPRGGFGVAPGLGPNDGALPDVYLLTPGRYYVNGVLCENADVRHSDAPGPYLPGKLTRGKIHLLFLDAWEREITFIQDDTIRETALGGPDTCLRTTVAWRVRAADKAPEGAAELSIEMQREDLWQDWSFWTPQWQGLNRGLLQARARPDASQDTDPCVSSPAARYRGPENQLYRVEIHQGGNAGMATFKWSRNNGSETFAIRRTSGDTAFVESLRGDHRLKSAAWVELLDDEMERNGATGILLQVDAVDERQTAVWLKIPAGTTFPVYDENAAADRHPYLRLWDQTPKLAASALTVTEGDQDTDWLTLEDGVQIRFQPGGAYRAGDYWLIPARTATGDVEWPGLVGQPEPRPPHGVEHHYAPLAIVSLDNGGELTINDMRKLFSPVLASS